MRVLLVPSPVAGTARAYVERGLTVFTVLWQAGWTFAEIAPGVIGGKQPLATASLGLSVVTLAVVAATLWGPQRWRGALSVARACDVVALIMATAVVSFTVPLVPGTWPLGAQMAVMTAVAGALTAFTRWGVVVVVLTAGISFVGVLWGPASVAGVGEAVKVSIYAVALATGALVLAWGMRRTGSLMEVAHRQLATATAARLAEQEIERANSEHERVLHDTVLNTLSAIARGGLEGREGDIRLRCAASADELRRLDGGESYEWAEDDRDEADVLPASVRAECDRLTASGVRVTVDVGRGCCIDVPDHVSRALASATCEALRNVQRHARAGSVVLTYRASVSGSAEVWIADDGVGGAREQAGRLGLPRSVQGAMANVGGTAVVTDLPDGGTRVTLLWSPTEAPHGGTATRGLHLDDDLVSVLAQIAPVFLLTFICYSAIVLFSSWTDYALPMWAVAAFLLGIAFSVPAGLVPRVAAWVGLQGTGRWAGPRTLVGVALAAVSAPLIVSSENTAIAGLTMAPWEVFSSELALAVLFTAVLLGPWWTVLVMLVSWVMAQGGDPWELIRPGSLMLIAAALFARGMRRRAMAHDATIERLVALEAQMLASSEDVDRRRRRYAALLLYTLPLLDRIAAGALDPMDPAVRRRCAEEERVARSVVRVDPHSDELAAGVYDMVVHGRSREVFIDAEISALEAQPRSSADEGSLGQLLALVDALPPYTLARVTGAWEEGTAVLRLVAPPPEGETPPSLGVGTLPPTDTEDDGTRLWEVVVAHA